MPIDLENGDRSKEVGDSAIRNAAAAEGLKAVLATRKQVQIAMQMGISKRNLRRKIRVKNQL